MVKSLTALVALVATGAVVIGLTSPDGEVRTSPTASPSATSPAPPSPTPGSTPEQPGEAPEPPGDPAALAPAAVAGTWPGRPAATTESDGVFDWCPAVVVEVSAGARQAVGDDAARAAACRAVSFVFDVRYSRLSLPRDAYTPADFDPVAAALTDQARTRTFPARVAAAVAAPRSAAARQGTGLVALDDAGPGRQFFGTPGTEDGYVDRAVWVDPAWSTVRVDLVSTGPRLLLRASFEASAAMPVWSPLAGVAEQLRVPSSVQLTLGGPDWRVDGWTLSQGRPSVEPLGPS